LARCCAKGDRVLGLGRIVVMLAGNIGVFLLNGGAVNIVRNVQADVPGQVQLVDELYASTERKNASVQPVQ
jgi:hypothetical protein